LLILSGRDEAALQTVKNECIQINTNNYGGGMKVECITADLASKSSVDSLATTALQLAPIDILINNGGISSRSSFVETKIEVDELLMQVNFLSGAALAKKVVPGMLERNGGKIVWVSSVQGKGKLTDAQSIVYYDLNLIQHIKILMLIVLHSRHTLQNKLCSIQIRGPGVLRSPPFGIGIIQHFCAYCKSWIHQD
jgi:NAD(P)-dependent dehydrogenase (short-subunit alcohol dehydrogenase family)